MFSPCYSSFTGSPISLLHADPFQELVWYLSSSTLTSLSFDPESPLQVYSSFPVTSQRQNESVCSIEAISGGILVATSRGVGFFTRGGAKVEETNTCNEMPDLVAGMHVPFPTNYYAYVVANQENVGLVDLSTKKMKLACNRKITCFAKERNFFCDGNEGGCLEVRDLRSMRLENSISAHSGPIKKIEISSNIIATCGSTDSVSSRYAKYDPIVKIYDVRMLRPLQPLVFHGGAAFVKFVPNYESSLAIASSSGYLRIMDPESKGLGLTSSFQTSHMLSCMDIGSAGSFIFSDPAGVVTVWSEVADSTLNLEPYIPETALPYSWTNCDIPVDSEIPLSEFIVPQAYAEESAHLGSKIVWKKKVTQPFPLVDMSLFKDVKRDGNTAIIAKMDGFVGNCMQSMKKYSKIHKKSSAFRKQLMEELIKDRLSRGVSDPSYQAYASVLIPADARPDTFNPGNYNSTSLAGLDNSLPNSYVNAVLQVLYFIPYFRQNMMNHLCEKEACVTCELGFLFHMLDKSKGQIAIARNLLRHLKQIPEAVTLGLLDSVVDVNATSSTLSLPQRIQSLVRFLLEHLHKENASFSSDSSFGSPIIVSGGQHSVIDCMFGSRQANQVVCHHCSNRFVRVSNLYSFPFNYPPILKDKAITFEELLVRSMRAESTSRVWCSNCNAYQLVNEVKVIQNLPNTLVLQANIQSETQQALWRSKSFVPLAFKIKLNGSMAPEVSNISLDELHNIADDSHSSLSFSDIGGAFSNKNLDSEYEVSSRPASKTPKIKSISLSDENEAIYYLTAVLSHVYDYPIESEVTSSSNPYSIQSSEHLVAHCFVPEHHVCGASTPNAKEASFKVGDGSWYLFNDFSVQEASRDEVVNFSLLFKQPCLLVYSRLDSHKRLEIPPSITPVAQLVWADRSISKKKSNKERSQAFASIQSLSRGSLVALDAEFVCSEKEETVLKDHRTVIVKPARLVLARVSVIQSTKSSGDIVIIDDYITQKSELIVDYLTKYSGIVPEDLDPAYSSHNLVPLKLAYIRLRALVDIGVIFVGHGLKKDFSMINMYVPPSQIIDTVEIYHLPGQRYLSLRFLAIHVLKLSIQENVHDSIEDSKTALELYRKYLEYQNEGNFEQLLCELYRTGHQTHFK